MFNFKKYIFFVAFFIFMGNILLGEGEEISYNLELGDIPHKKNSDKLKKDTGSLFILAGATAAFLYTLPESTTRWGKNEESSLFEQWKRNVTSGPVWDHDNPGFNYIGHAYTGGVYYILARNANYSKYESFWYSFFISTFFWEYGIEAFAERPSMQDIVITPVFGSMVGEGFYILQNYILDNNGMLFNSKFLGSTTMMFMDPMGHLSSYLYDDYQRTSHVGVMVNAVEHEGETKLLLGINFIFSF
ncbi:MULTISPECIES: DUF3943 domain-containing protein [Psychrilyobacter]|uniref:DUF3943 domain-containing protein n=1 Tax=Psychrilyobacter piezotolerans TaxID=2293438 RepID=A0ABX9KF16_9FUSO|nr:MULTISPECIES: DUF3943 domain-containing protein [Psychrilyobacter]MCS5421286.1 DUF3943 domain-containing protein [Psychrilyobacter sp. S5]NDI78149.1 DUF3943 domain-containing protein [Psychrilyobacter piezotolerans]RDE60159.1 DUF3943 domain-containing protein [Psychrilyobacter sp. S5]REI40341.1 DUF3943 domain-containing protein [Psychrilyobacter piezotolerans]